MRDLWKRLLQNMAIFLLVLIGLKNLLTALPLKFTSEFAHLYGMLDNMQAAAVHGILSFVLGILMLLLAWSLYRRIRNAWLAEVVILSSSIILQIVRFHRFTIPIVLIEMFVLVVLSFSHRDFGRRADKVTLKWALVFIGISFLLLLANASVGLYLMQAHIRDMHSLINAGLGSLKLLFFMDTSVLQMKSTFGRIYADSLITLNWLCIFSSALFLLKPLIYDPIRNKVDQDRVRRLVLEHGQNPSSYLALENDKRYFFSNSVEGVCAYTVVGKVFVCCGDIICAEENRVHDS